MLVLILFWFLESWPVTYRFKNRCILVALCHLIASGSSNQEVSSCSGKITGAGSVPCCTWKCVSTALSSSINIFEVPSMLFVLTDEFSVRVTIFFYRISVSWTHILPFLYLPLFWNEISILSKVHKPDNCESHNSLKFSFINIQTRQCNFVGCEYFLE